MNPTKRIQIDQVIGQKPYFLSFSLCLKLCPVRGLRTQTHVQSFAHLQ